MMRYDLFRYDDYYIILYYIFTILYNMKNNICNSKMNFQECELAIVRQAVDNAEKIQGRKVVQTDEIQNIITILEGFLRLKECVCYGGTAINNILPKQEQFYDKTVEIPDYDFYTPHALDYAKKLVDLYIEKGFEEVEAKSAQHHNTYKVYVNFIPIADISYIPKELFQSIKKEAIRVAGILYAPPNFLRMGMYLELSRPGGDVSRWEKVMKRLTLLNKNYPLKSYNCEKINFQRTMDNTKISDTLYENIKQTFIDQDVVFFGGYALTLYSQYMPKNLKKKLLKVPDFDVLSEEPLLTAQIVKERLRDINIHNVKIIKREGVGEIIAPNYEIRVGKDTVAFIYFPIACHSYNILKEGGYEVKVATLDTMLSFWLSFLYANKPYYDKNRILCMATYLFNVQQKNRLNQKGLLKRFSLKCIGHQDTVEEMRAEKAKKFLELKKHRDASEFEEWFLRYRPIDKKLSDTLKNLEEQSAASKRTVTTKKTHLKANKTQKTQKTNKTQNKQNINSKKDLKMTKKKQIKKKKIDGFQIFF